MNDARTGTRAQAHAVTNVGLALHAFCEHRASAVTRELEEQALGGPFDRKRNVPLIDLGTVRETLACIRDDFQRVAGLQRAAELIGSALAEIEAAERRRLAPIPRSVLDMRLLTRRRH